MNPYLLKLLPYAIIVVLAGVAWGMYGYMQAADEKARVATERADKADAKIVWLEQKKAADEKLLADRENERAAALDRVAKLERGIREFTPDEKCLTLDVDLPWLDRLLPVGSEVHAR